MTTTKTSEDESLEWAKKAYAKLKERKNIKFRSKLEEKVADLSTDSQEFVVAKGGKGGSGNLRFKSSTNRSPRRITKGCLLYTSPSPRDGLLSRMPSSA